MQGHSHRSIETTEAADDAEACRGLSQIIDRIGDKWTVMVVGHLSGGSMRFTALMRSIPSVSQRMLTLTLRSLERDGLVKRTAYATVPPRVEYELTQLGSSLDQPLSVLAQWANAKRAEIERARLDYDVLATNRSDVAPPHFANRLRP